MTEPGTPSWRWKAAFAVSVLLNMAVAMLLVGLVMDHGPRGAMEQVGLVREEARPYVPFTQQAADRFADLPGADLTVIGDSHVELGEWDELLDRPVAKRGLSGQHIADVTAWVDLALAHDPDTVVVWAGTNNVLAGHDADHLGSQMRELLAAVDREAPAADVVVLTVPPMPGWPDEVSAANTVLTREAEAAGADVVDISSAVPSSDALWADGVHLTEPAYREVADLLLAHLDG